MSLPTKYLYNADMLVHFIKQLLAHYGSQFLKETGGPIRPNSRRVAWDPTVSMMDKPQLLYSWDTDFKLESIAKAKNKMTIDLQTSSK